MSKRAVITYIRVSTSQQVARAFAWKPSANCSVSSQRLRGWLDLVREYVEVETGKGSDDWTAGHSSRPRSEPLRSSGVLWQSPSSTALAVTCTSQRTYGTPGALRGRRARRGC
jgi:hypothetical protein